MRVIIRLQTWATLAVVLVAGVFILVMPADATTIDWTVTPVSFDDGGSVSGTFSIDTTVGLVTAFDVTTTAGSTLGGYAFNATTSYEAGPDSLRLLLFSNDGNHQLYLQFFSNPYTATSFLAYQSVAERFYDGGPEWLTRLSTFNFNDPTLVGIYSSVATPIPGALPLFATGLGVMGLLGWRRKRKVATTATRSCLVAAALAAGIFSWCVPSNVYASPITYNMDLIVGTGSVVGSITTDGTIGTLIGSDITNYNLTLTHGAYTTVINTPGATTNSTSLTATANAIFFDFSSNISAYFVLEGLLGFEDASGNLSSHPSTISLNLLSIGDPNSPVWAAYSGNVQIAQTPLPAAFPLFASGLCALGMLVLRRKRKATPAAA